MSEQGGPRELRSDLGESCVTHKTTMSYTPQPNIENLSGQLRAIMRSNFTRTNSPAAWCPFVRHFADSRSTSRDSATGKTPLELVKTYFENKQNPVIQQVAQSKGSFKEWGET